MRKNQNTLVGAKAKSEQLHRIGMAAIMLVMFCAFVLSANIMPVLAGEVDGDTTTTGGIITNPAIKAVMDTVLSIVKTASLCVGVVIIIWGVFQIIMALRREDSEAVGKQVTTIVVGGVLSGFGLIIDPIYKTLMTEINGG